MIDIIMSKFSKQNSLYIYKSIEEKLKNGEKSFLIVPEQYTLESDIEFINSINYTSVMDAKVLSFNSLITFISQRLSLKKRETLTSISKTIIITSILNDINNELKLFHNKSDDIDFVKDIANLISNIKEYYFDDDFFKSIEENQNIDNMTRLKFKEIKLIYDNYCKKIEKSYLDSEDELTLIKEHIKDCDFLKNTNFYFDKFDSLSELKIDFIKELLKIDVKINISIPIDKNYYENKLLDDLDIYKQGFNFVEKLKEIDSVNIKTVENNSFEDIKHLYENFEKYNPKIYGKNTENISYLESISSTNEVENIGLLIEKLIRNNISFNQIALIVSDANEYENLIKRIFNRLNIPIFLDKSKKMTENHILKTWLSLLRLVIYNFRKDDLENFIRSSLVDFGENSLEKVIIFQNYMVERKIKSSMIFEDKYFVLDEEFYENNQKLKKEKEEELESVNSIRNKLVNLTSSLYEYRTNKHKASDLVKEIYNMLSNDMLKNGFIHYQENISEKDLKNYEENEQIWNKLMEILDQIVAILNDSKISLTNLYKLIEKACENATVSIIPPAIDQVLVGDFSKDSINNRDIKIFVGMNDLYFPNSNNSDKLISEKEKSELKSFDIDLKIYDDKKDDKKLLNLLRMITSSKKIIFSYSLINKSNEAMNISPTLLDILAYFPNMKIKKMAVRDYNLLKYSKDLLDQKVYENLWKVKRDEKIKENDTNLSKTYLNFKKNSKTNREYNNAKINGYNLFLKGFNYTNTKLPLDKNISKSLYNKNKFSVSEIESYARCPYKYFINYGIKAKEKKSLDVDYMELGNIVHYNMEQISKKLKGVDIENIDKESFDKLIEENFKESIKLSLDKQRKDDNKNKYILSNIYNSNKISSKKVLEQIKQGEFIIDEVEQKYGKGESYPEVYVDDTNYLEGRIDRIDRYLDYIRIIDYKTGDKSLKIQNILNGFELQLFVYLISVKGKKSEESFENLKPIASFYLSLNDEVKKLDKSYDRESIEKIYDDKLKMDGLIIKIDDEVLKILDRDFDGKKSNIFRIQKSNKNIFSQEEEKIVEKFVKKIISKYIKEIKNGNISLSPLRINKDEYECKNCKIKSICKFDYSIDQDKFKDVDNNISILDIKKELEDE